MKQYVLLLPHARDRYSDVREDDYMEIVKDYVAWVQKLMADGVYVGGHKLADEPGRTLTTGSDGVTVHDSPSTELAEILGGIMIIKAKDYDDAVRIAKTHPHMTHNTRLEIREIHDV